jgi:hypothetical protein
MAQLTDDCFAFSGPLLPILEVERILRERIKPVAETETVPPLPLTGVSSRATSRPRSICRPSTIRRSTATRCAPPIWIGRARPGLRSAGA